MNTGKVRKTTPKQRKKSWNWDADCVRCANCKHFRKTHIVLVNSLPRAVLQHCELGGFHTTPLSACDMWDEKPAKKKTAVSSKDRVPGFYPDGVGSIPARQTNNERPV